MRNIVIIVVSFFQICLILPASLKSQQPSRLKFALPVEPQLFYGKNKTALVYDVHLRDSLGKAVKVDNFEIFDNKNNLVYNNNYVEQSSFEGDTNRYVKYIWINIAEIPPFLSHRITYHIGNQVYKFSKEINVSQNKNILSIMPPIQKEVWLVWHAPADSLSHRRTHTEFLSIYDSLQDGYIIGYNNQRFAMDFEKLNGNGKIADNQGKYNSDYVGYGVNVVAVADGKVVATMDSIPDNPNPPNRKKNWDIDSICGNYIALDIGNNLIALYAHLRPNSINVKAGDIIKRGTIIGQIGNTGKSSGAHLHFQISKYKVPYKKSGNSFLSEGMSFVFNKYTSYDWPEDYDISNIKENETLRFIHPINIENRLPYLNEIIEIK